MRQQPYNPPSLYAKSADELAVNGKGLLNLMTAVLDRGAAFRFKARGFSMAPFIRDGDIITVEPVNRAHYGKGTIAAFTRPQTGQLVVHRIISVARDAVYIIGDNNADCTDGWVPIKNLLGSVTRIDRNGQRVWLGLGIERYLIAWLSGSNQLHQLRNIIARLRHGRPKRTTE